ncbi:4-(cytidine 5'-diphospho)-2-C-methyl-D-erythritol kinase, partial [Staphylococcus aureus]
AAQLFSEQYKLKQGVTISNDKEIPVSAGLAGGSADEASTLSGLNRLFDIGAILEELALLGSKNGTDIPFC